MAASIYQANDAAAYQKAMGRWSHLLADLFIGFAAPTRGGSMIDVGCGTGSLTFALSRKDPEASLVGLDYSQVYVDYARAQSDAPHVRFEQGDAVALPYGDGEFDAALSLLALNFVPDAERAAHEMKRVTKPGGVVAASVWDFRGGLTFLRVFSDTAAVLDPGGEEYRAKQYSAPFTGPGEFEAAWRRMGLKEVEQTSLTIRMEFQSFADYWEPWLGGQGTVGAYVISLSQEKKARLEHHLRLAYLAGGDDGPRSFAATAWAVRGIV